MLRTFIQERNKKSWNELIRIDTESGKVKIYSINKKLGFPFSEYYTTVTKMGYKSINDMIKQIKTNKKEIDTDRQIAKEITGLLKLAKHRAEQQYNDIVERLKVYGMTEAEALKRIDYFINHNIERHNVKVTYSDNTTITTAINGSIKEIENYYKIGSVFNTGMVTDSLQSVTKLEFIY